MSKTSERLIELGLSDTPRNRAFYRAGYRTIYITLYIGVTVVSFVTRKDKLEILNSMREHPEDLSSSK